MWLRILYLGILMLATMSAYSQATPVKNELASTVLDSQQLATIHQLATRYAPGGEVAIALINGDQTIFYGVRRDSGAVIETDNHDHAFAIGSISKVFTATLLAEADTEGRVKLDDRVSDAYDFPFADSLPFTYRQLANHTAGLPRLPSNMGISMFSPYAGYTPEKLETYLRDDMNLGNQEKSDYSNLGFGILAYTLTHRLDKTTYGKALQEKIFSPLGMDHSSDGPDSTRAQLVQGYDIYGARAPYWDFTDALAGAGAVVSTPEDMALFLRAQFDEGNATLTLTRRPTFIVDDQQAVGLGWQILIPQPDQTVYWHNGAVAGYRSFTAVDVEKRLGVVVLTNVLLMDNEVDATGMRLLNSLRVE